MNVKQESLFVVQCTMGKPEFESFVDCSEPINETAADVRAERLKDPNNWMGGKVGKIRIVTANESNCYAAYKAQGFNI